MEVVSNTIVLYLIIKKVVNISHVYEISKCIKVSDYPAPENCLFSSVTMAKNADIDKYKYYGYWIGVDRHGSFSFSNGLGRNVIILGVDISSSIHVDNKGKDILILLIDPRHGIGEHSLTEETIYLVSFTERNRKVCLSLHYNGVYSHLFFNGKEIHKFKAKISEIVATPLCLGNISKYWLVDNMKDNGLNRYVYDAIAVDEILNIHSYLMKKNEIS